MSRGLLSWVKIEQEKGHGVSVRQLLYDQGFKDAGIRVEQKQGKLKYEKYRVYTLGWKDGWSHYRWGKDRR